MLNKVSIDRICVGDFAEIVKKIESSDVELFADLSGDYNPVHLDDRYAASSRYKKRIAHGLMVSSLFSGLFGAKLPGEGCVYKSQNLKFKRPVYIGDVVTARIEVVDVDKIKKTILFSTKCLVDNKTVIDGVAEIFVP